MKLQRFKSVFALIWLFLMFKCNQVTSTTPSIIMDELCELSADKDDRCSTYCYKSVKPPHTYIQELRDQIKANAERNLEKDNEIRELRQRFLDLSDYRDHIKALNQQIEELRRTNDILRNNFGKTEKDLNDCTANRDTLEKEIEAERNSQTEKEEKFKSDLQNLKKKKNRIINELESKLRKESSDSKEKQEILDMNFRVPSKNTLTVEQDIVKNNESPPKTSCIGLPTSIYRIKLPGLDPFSALCNGDVIGGGWIVIQKRFDGSEDFYRNWTEYRNGFGKFEGEFFLGLELLHRITNSQRFELFIIMESFNEQVDFARYENFTIGNENEKYKVQSVGNFAGSVRNLLSWTIRCKFSTYDQDNYGDFAKVYHSGWWFNRDHVANLNGKYYSRNVKRFDSMYWQQQEPLKSVQMLIRPFNITL